ncbi:hypothetical protein KPL70_026286 [Citrus sinensis]|nr:hypothetical protein KPL70_026286 [Citrus sinensis]
MSEVEVVVMAEVGISTTTTPIMPKEKAQPEDEAEAIQDRVQKKLSEGVKLKISEATQLIHTDKSEVFEAFKKFKVVVEKESGYQVKAMRSDREEQQEPATPPMSPESTTGEDSLPSFLNEKTEERTRSLQDLYEVTERHDNLTLFYLFADCEPVNFQEAALDEKWRIVMDEEIKAIVKNDTCELSTLPKGHKVIGVKWVYKTKRNAKGEIERPKVRLVAKGYSQKAGIDYDENGFTKCPYEHALYVKEKDGDILIVCLYVDDLIFTGSDPSLFEEFKRVMIKEFEMIDIGLMAYYLGIKVKQKEECIFISQESYAKEILKKFKMNDCTTNFDLLYSFSNDYKLIGYSDSDWGGDVDDRKSTTRFVFLMGDTAFTWMSKKQPIVTLSTCEAEYVAATSSVFHAIWLRNLLKELGFLQEEPSEICVDNKSAIVLFKNPVFHD